MLTAWMLCLLPAGDPLIVSQPSVDVGQVFVGQQLVRRFSIRNAGAEPLTITDMRASCGCAAPTLDRRTLKPGESTEVKVDVNTLSQPAGPIRWNVHIDWRAGATEGRTSLELTAQLIREIELEPAALALVAAPGFHHDIVLTDRRPAPLAMTAAHVETAGLRAELLPATSSRSRAVRIHVLESCPAGVTTDTLHIGTDDPKYPELRVPITVTRKSTARMSAVPERPIISAGGSVLVQLRGRNQEPIQIERLETSHPALTTRWAAGPGSFATLRIGIDKSKWDGRPFSTSVTVHCLQPGGETISIPISVRSDD
jgi:hypothetical protein